MYRTPITAADARLLKARAVVRTRDELIARRDVATAEVARVTAELGRLEKHIEERARGFLRLSYRPRQAEDVARHRALMAELARLTEELVAIAAQLATFRGAVRELADAREAKHALLVEAGAPSSADLAAIAAQLAREDAVANELDDAIAQAARAEVPLRGTAAILRTLDAREARGPIDKARHPGTSARALAREAHEELSTLWDLLVGLGHTPSHPWLDETFASLLAYIQVDGRIIEARATTASLLAELTMHVAALHRRSAEIAHRVATLVTERDHLLE